MPLTENDIIRIRQFIQHMESGLIEGMQVFVTYHDSNLAALPSNPTGDGTTGGWHREPTEASNWMSVKTALKDTAGTWGTPIRVFGLQGTETAGVGLSADIPKLEQITFIGDNSSKVGWTAGTVRYNGSSYAIAVKAVGDGSTDAYIYWDDADGQTSFKTTDTFATAIAANHWVICFNDSGKAIPATSARILHGGLIQAATITAAKIIISGINALDLANAPAEAGADVTGDHQGDVDLGNVTGDLDDISDGSTYAKMLEAWKKVGDATKIDGGQISAATILAVAIATYNLTAANATIENLMVKTAHIDNLNVSTGKIANDAGHLYESIMTAGNVVITAGPGKTTLQTLVITSAGSMINALASVWIEQYGNPGGATVTDVYLYEGAGVLGHKQITTTTQGEQYTVTFAVPYSPGSGSKTFTIQAVCDNLSTMRGHHRAIALDESKGK